MWFICRRKVDGIIGGGFLMLLKSMLMVTVLGETFTLFSYFWGNGSVERGVRERMRTITGTKYERSENIA